MLGLYNVSKKIFIELPKIKKSHNLLLKNPIFLASSEKYFISFKPIEHSGSEETIVDRFLIKFLPFFHNFML